MSRAGQDAVIAALGTRGSAAPTMLQAMHQHQVRRETAAKTARPATERVDPAMDDQRRIYFLVTDLGVQALAAELERYRQIMAIAQQRNLLPTRL